MSDTQLFPPPSAPNPASESPTAPHEPGPHATVGHSPGVVGSTPGPSGPGTSKASRRLAFLVTLGAFGVLGVALGGRLREANDQKAKLAAAQAEEDAAQRTKLAQSGGPATLRPSAAKWTPTVTLTGTLAPIQEADLAFKMGGKLTSASKGTGATVKRGDVLAAVDGAEVDAQLAAARAGIRTAEIGLAMARDGEKRTLSLFQSGSTSDMDKTMAEQRAALSLAQLEQARAQARIASVAAQNLVLTAPFDGVLTRVPTGLGKIVGPGEPLFHLEDLSVLRLQATISEGEARLVEVGAQVELDGVMGKVTAVLPSLDAMTRRVPVLAEIPNPGQLLARAFVRATVKASKEIDVVKLPLTSLRPGSQDEVVVVEAGVLRIRPVVFVTSGSDMLVQKGLTQADVVLAAPSAEVRDGQPLAPPQN
jgi:RND family efflux transporter MFP subunit